MTSHPFKTDLLNIYEWIAGGGYQEALVLTGSTYMNRRFVESVERINWPKIEETGFNSRRCGSASGATTVG